MRKSICKLSNLNVSTFGYINKTSILKRTVTTKKSKERPHEYYKWGYKPLPTQTAIDEHNPQFSVRSPEFKLPNPKGRIHRREWRQRIAKLQQSRQDPELEQLARSRQLMVSLGEIDTAWRKEFGLFDIANLSKFYGINRDLFDNDDIIAKTWLDIAFNDVKIHRGNIVQPKLLLNPPTNILYESDTSPLHSLILTNVDGHPTDSSKELVHWMVCNIKGSDISNGETVHEYIPPVPWKGTGFHRLIFALYEHNDIIDVNSIKSSNISIKSRTFLTPSFRSIVNCIPIALSWCQVEWDESVSKSCELFSDLDGEPLFDWEEYIEPKDEQRILKTQLSEMRYRNM